MHVRDCCVLYLCCLQLLSHDQHPVPSFHVTRVHNSFNCVCTDCSMLLLAHSTVTSCDFNLHPPPLDHPQKDPEINVNLLSTKMFHTEMPFQLQL